ncbi:hypothetical protein PWG14_20890 (plasmid) [Chromobacterium amazonense]|uniref:hypothetical protein n=1 Tax=Chromobacterium amazonense TaxID=1382803 RepID=UPI00237ED05D|nr:hypothetical protein [Chromobacterium amazonense]MDE1714949.1 hypothetical protein [Chromobacterium amazonense]
MAKLPVKVYFSTDTGAPVWNDAPGSVLAILESCLVTGFNLRPCRAVAWANGVATISLDQGHGYKWPDVVELRDAVPSDVNGEYRVKEAGADFIKIDCPVEIATVSAASLRRAPLGFSKPFAAGNVGVFQSQMVGGSGACLRVDDSNTQSDYRTLFTLIKAYEKMTSIDEGSGKFVDGGLTKICREDGSSIVPWILVGDAGAFYLFCDYRGANNAIKSRSCFFFGDPAYATPPLIPAAICVSRTDLGRNASAWHLTSHCRYFNGGFYGTKMSRSIDDVSTNGSGIVLSRLINTLNIKILCGNSSQNAAVLIPDPIAANGFYIGTSPGARLSTYKFQDLSYLENRYLAVQCICDNDQAESLGNADASVVSCVMMDVLGPWR